MNKKFIQTNLNQTGVAIFSCKDEEDIIIPLFGRAPLIEARSIEAEGHILPNNYSLKNTFISNNLLDYRIEDAIKDFINREGFLPEDMVDDIVTGFPFIEGEEFELYPAFYA